MNVQVEEHIRSYLRFLEDPASAIDTQHLASVRSQLETETDPVQKLRLITEIQRTEQGNGEHLKQQFILHAKTWATEQAIPTDSFLTLGVPADVLRSAGLKPPSHAAASTSPGGRVTTGTVIAAALRQRDAFTLADLEQATQASPMTLRKAVNELIEQGTVERIGPHPNWQQQGRAPILYRVHSTP